MTFGRSAAEPVLEQIATSKTNNAMSHRIIFSLPLILDAILKRSFYLDLLYQNPFAILTGAGGCEVEDLLSSRMSLGAGVLFGAYDPANE